MSDWTKRMDGYAEAGERYRVEVLKGPQLEYIGLLADRGLVRLRVRAKLRRGLESKGKRRAMPEDRGRQKIDFEEYWTFSRPGGGMDPVVDSACQIWRRVFHRADRHRDARARGLKGDAPTATPLRRAAIAPRRSRARRACL